MELEIEKTLAVLRNGGTILYPTDTVWGLGCDASNEVAVEKIFSIKKRAEEKSLVLLLANEKSLSEYCENVNPEIFEYLDRVEKPTTVVYEKAKNLPTKLIQDDGTIAIRLVKDEFCISLIEALGHPLVSTSANISGEKTPLYFEDISEEIINAVDYVVQQRSTEIKTNVSSSSIIKIDTYGNIIVIRP